MFSQRRNAQAGLVLSMVLMVVTLTIVYRGSKDAVPHRPTGVAMKGAAATSVNQDIHLAGLSK